MERGWMAHVNMFAGSDDPKVIWDADNQSAMAGHTGHPAVQVRR
jgi:hypothetical protein